MGLSLWHHWRSIVYIFLSCSLYISKKNKIQFFIFAKRFCRLSFQKVPFVYLKKTWSFFYKINKITFQDYYSLDIIIKKCMWIVWWNSYFFSQLKSWPQTIWYPMKKEVMDANQKQIAYSVHLMQNVPGVVILTHVMINPKTIHYVYTQIPN
jgi:hypothetical protein